MNAPGEQHWLRVEELSGRLSSLPKSELAAEMSRLAAEGESPTVLTLLGSWLELAPLPPALKADLSIDGRYTLLECLGSGGMGMVWRARQELVGREVALKMIHPGLVTPELKSQFHSEIEALGRLNHPGIARIFDAGFYNRKDGSPIPYFAMELVEGKPLDRWVGEVRRGRRELLETAAAICEAVQSAHERRIVHRDLKPSNILVKPDGRPVVVDFGIARLAGVIIGEQRGVFTGTFAYAAPEQHLGCDGDYRSGESVDIYALGAILFEMFAGRKLFVFPKGASMTEKRAHVLEAKLPRLSEVVSDCPPLLEKTIARALRRDPADRYFSMVGFARAIHQVMDREAAVPLEPPWEPAADRLVPGTQWRLQTKIGEGGAGQVWLGRHDQLGESRVFKFCDSEEKARTLKRELTLFRLLKGRVGLNPHFIQIHDVSLDEPPWYLMMEHVPALDLTAWADRQPGGLAAVSEAVRLEIVIQAAEALQAAHEAGILHRDIKPGNLLVRNGAEESGLHVYITDFGIGQLIVDGLLRRETRMGFTRTVSELARTTVSGTLIYLAPEVMEGNEATVRSDVYSLGVVLWQLLIGNLHAALDPTGWQTRIMDSHLQEDLARCLAGTPERRWSSAGEFAAQLRNLPARRGAAARRLAEMAARERAAYRQGVLKAAGVALGLVLIFATVAAVAWVQSRAASRARGALALGQALTLKQSDFASGRKARGLNLLEIAARTSTNAAALRTASAAVLGLSDLLPVGERPSPSVLAVGPGVPRQPRELIRTASPDGQTMAVARDVDGLNGAVDLFRTNGLRLGTIQRLEFPWVPLAEPELLSFSSDGQYLALGGAASSRHVLIFKVADAALKTYLFHGTDPQCCAWHPRGRFLAVGCADDTVRIWDTAAGVNPAGSARPGSHFDLPPALDALAEDRPLHILRGQRGAVTHVVFDPGGRWLAVLDAVGYLRIYLCYYPDPPAGAADHEVRTLLASDRDSTTPVFSTEVRLEDVGSVTGLAAEANRVLIRRAGGITQEFQFVPEDLPVEVSVSPGISSVDWNGTGTELCAMSLTDFYWLHASPPAIFQTMAGENPLGIAGTGATEGWAVVQDGGLSHWEPAPNHGGALVRRSQFMLSEALPGGATRGGLAAAGDGRLAVYYGKRIQFFRQHRPAPVDASVVADGGGGVFQKVFWDRPGRLLGVTFALPDGRRQLETWETSTNFPPQCRTLPPMVLDCQEVVPANDGRHCLARGARHGLWELAPAETGIGTGLDPSSAACQSAPFACAADGSLVAMVVDHTTIRLLERASGRLFADLPSARQTGITGLAWDGVGTHLASVTEDGFVQVWNLAPWRRWLAVHQLQQ
jgi:serine/threonine protein kinase